MVHFNVFWRLPIQANDYASIFVFAGCISQHLSLEEQRKLKELEVLQLYHDKEMEISAIWGYLGPIKNMNIETKWILPLEIR